ncbi:MAG: cupin domain-containing protein [Acidobacteria bacterium]|nr:cupin domain-containing protein [Acidobacteriota bacterium]MBI3281472.1 cupin domain-containing protein [Acidobacteriota bacterium]
MKKMLMLLAATCIIAGSADRQSFKVNISGIQWTAVQPPGAPPGLMQKLLHDNQKNKLTSAIVRFPKGYREPRHYHTTCGHSIYVLKGRLRSPEGDLTPGTFIYSAVQERHGPFQALEETEILFYTDGPFDYLVDDPDAPKARPAKAAAPRSKPGR